MYKTFFSQKIIRTILCLATLSFLAACTPAAAIEPTQGPQPVSEVATPPAEVFIPLNPSPTPVESTLPMTCQITDLNVYVDEARGYCFAYPLEFSRDESQAADGIVSVVGPALDDSAEPLRASLEIGVQPLPAGSDLALLVNAYLTSLGELPWEVARETTTLGGEPAESLEPIPGLLSSRMLLTLHNNQLITLRFHPSDMEQAKPGLEALSQTVTCSFAYLPARISESQIQSVSWYEFGQNIGLSYDATLAPWVEARSIAAVPVSDQILYAEAQPAYAQFRFLGFQGGRLYDLPLLPIDGRMAQVRVFRTADFPGYGDEHPLGFVGQLQALNELLETGLDPARCAQPYDQNENPLPYLPWINQQQVFCAQPQMIDFAGGRGIRYITYFAQGPGPALDDLIFYTFQGLTQDGQFYVAAFFPLQTGIFPIEAPPCPKCGQADYDPFPEWAATLAEQVTQLNALPADDFAPSLNLLDALVQSIQIGQ